MNRAEPAAAYPTRRPDAPEVCPVPSAEISVGVSRINFAHSQPPLRDIKMEGLLCAPPGEFLRRPAPFRHALQSKKEN